jgi:hypothetical protein
MGKNSVVPSASRASKGDENLDLKNEGNSNGISPFLFRLK